jgi:hypothetical protein
MITGSDALGARLQALTEWLLARAPLWQERPFTGVTPSWAQAEPALHRWLLGFAERGSDAVDALHARLSDPQAADHDDAPAAWRALAAEARSHTLWATWPARTRPATARPPRIPDRKWREIEGFSELLGEAWDSRPLTPDAWLVDWCAGKAHVGRALARRLGARLWALDHDEALSEEACALARADGVRLRFDRCDLLAAPPPPAPGPLGWAVGLHACGGLGHRLLRFAVEADTRGVALAPCCLHRHHGAPGWPTMSEAARATGLTLDHAALRLATADETVARATLRVRRRRDEVYRQAIDLRLRALAGTDAHHPLGTLPGTWFEAPFPEFARRVGERLGHDLGPLPALEAALSEGSRRAVEARALGAVRALFRRPLELFAALDRALWLSEQGLEVSLGPFCPASVTPRNLAIIGARRIPA